MAETWTPGTAYPDLTLDRLIVVGDELRRVRDDCADAHRPHEGESALTLGVSAWECSKYAICRLSQRYSWLRIANGAAPGATHFIFQIGIYGVRFCHSDPNDLPDRYRMLTPEETFASQGALDLGQIPDGLALRFVVETAGPKHKTVGVHLVEFNESNQETIRSFRIPLSATSTVTPFVTEKEGVALPAPTVEIRREEKKTGDQG